MGNKRPFFGFYPTGRQSLLQRVNQLQQRRWYATGPQPLDARPCPGPQIIQLQLKGFTLQLAGRFTKAVQFAGGPSAQEQQRHVQVGIGNRVPGPAVRDPGQLSAYFRVGPQGEKQTPGAAGLIHASSCKRSHNTRSAVSTACLRTSSRLPSKR